MGYSTNSGPFWVGTLMFGIFTAIALFISRWLATKGKNQYEGYVLLGNCCVVSCIFKVMVR